MCGGVGEWVCVSMRVLDCDFDNSENVQTVYKLCKQMSCTIVQICVKIFLTVFVSASIIFVHSCL